VSATLSAYRVRKSSELENRSRLQVPTTGNNRDHFLECDLGGTSRLAGQKSTDAAPRPHAFRLHEGDFSPTELRNRDQPRERQILVQDQFQPHHLVMITELSYARPRKLGNGKYRTERK
jgi:hypothetical protein